MAYRRLKRLLNVLSGPKTNQSEGKILGDRARDALDWERAARQYRLHLLLWPDDAGIWVQLGHVTKESGRLDDAQAAYERAREIAPDNGDILLSLGHIDKLRGNMKAAIALYNEAVALDGDANAGMELAALGLPLPARKGTGPAAKDEALLNALGNASNSLDPLLASNVVPGRNPGDFDLLSDDPWIEFDITASEIRNAKIAILTVEAESAKRDRTLAGQVYVDSGKGYYERQSTHFPSDGKPVSILVIDPTSVKKLRWDPDRKLGSIRKASISLRAAENFAEIEAILTQNSDDKVLLAPLTTLLRTWYESKGDEDARKLSLPSLIYSGADLSHDYTFWRLANESMTTQDYRTVARMTDNLPLKPVFSLVMPTYNTPIDLLCECIDSMLNQTYPYFEICIADDNSPNPEVWQTLERYAADDPRIKIVRRKANGHISAASNSALALASGDFIVLMDHDDLIPDYALFTVAWYINKHPEADIFYSDEDKVDTGGHRSTPYFKSSYNEFLMFGHNMVSHLGIYRRSLVEAIGGFRLGLEGSQDYDLLLRGVERCGNDKIVHIPHVLYHWRAIPGSTAMSADQKSYAVVAAQEAINGYFERTGLPLRSISGFAPGCTGLKPSFVPATAISIIIPTRNGLDVLKPCIRSIVRHGRENAEILIIDNGSDDPRTIAYLRRLDRLGIARVLPYPEEFNFSLMNNSAAKEATGEILCFLNNDTEVLSRDWLDRARTFLSLPGIGAVGARLLYPDGTLQHFGIALGMGAHGVAGVPHATVDGESPGYFGKARLLQEVSAVTAACLFVRKSTFMLVGGFEAALRVAYNDIDLCLKIRAREQKILVDPDILLIHKESKTRGSDEEGARAARLSSEAEWMHDRWGDVLKFDPYYSPNLSLERVDFAYASPPRVLFPWRDSVPVKLDIPEIAQ